MKPFFETMKGLLGSGKVTRSNLNVYQIDSWLAYREINQSAEGRFRGPFSRHLF